MSKGPKMHPCISAVLGTGVLVSIARAGAVCIHRHDALFFKKHLLIVFYLLGCLWSQLRHVRSWLHHAESFVAMHRL